MAENERMPTVDAETVAALEALADGRGGPQTFQVSRDGQRTQLLHVAPDGRTSEILTADEVREQLDRLERMLRHTMYLVSVLAKIARVQPEELQAAHEVALQAERGMTEPDDEA